MTHIDWASFLIGALCGGTIMYIAALFAIGRENKIKQPKRGDKVL